MRVGADLERARGSGRRDCAIGGAWLTGSLLLAVAASLGAALLLGLVLG